MSIPVSFNESWIRDDAMEALLQLKLQVLPEKDQQTQEIDILNDNDLNIFNGKMTTPLRDRQYQIKSIKRPLYIATVTFELIKDVMHMDIEKASQVLGINSIQILAICRENNVIKWPSAAIQARRQSIATLEHLLKQEGNKLSRDTSLYAASIQKIYDEIISLKNGKALFKVSDVKKLIVGDNKNDLMESCEVTVQRSSGSFGGLNSAVDGERDEMTLIKLAPLIEVKKSIKHYIINLIEVDVLHDYRMDAVPSLMLKRPFYN